MTRAASAINCLRTTMRKLTLDAYLKKSLLTSLRQRMTEDMQVRNLALNTQTWVTISLTDWICYALDLGS